MTWKSEDHSLASHSRGGFLNGFLKLASTLGEGEGSILGAEKQRNYT